MAFSKRKPAPKRASRTSLAKTPAAIELTTQGQRALQDNRRATDAELTANLHASAKAYNRDLAAATKAGLIIRAALELPSAANSHDDNAASDSPGDLAKCNVVPPLVLLDHIGRKYL